MTNSDDKLQHDPIVQAYRQLLASLSVHLDKPICLVDGAKNLLWTNAAWGRQRVSMNSPTLTDWVDVELAVGKINVKFGRHQLAGYLEVYQLEGAAQHLWLLVFMADSDDPLEQRYNEVQTKMLQAQKLEGLGVLAARFAHDYSNLLTAILGNADFVAEAIRAGQGDSVSSRQAIESVIAASELSADMCRQLLAYAESGVHVGGDNLDHRARVELSDMLREMDRMIQIVTSQRADVVLDLEGAVYVWGDATHLRQLALNLIINAAEAMQEAGLIRICTGYVDADSDLLAETLFPDIPPGRYAYLEVVDNGMGMPEDTLTKIFDPFFSTKDSGRGLGLAAVFSIVQAHGGTVAVTSSAAGSSFKVLLPVPVD